jgi:hypothetical protein
MRDGATVDVGDLVVPSTGAMRIRITGATGEGAAASLFRDGRHVEQRRVGDAGEIAWDELSPGKYSVCVVRGGTAPLCGIAEIEVVPGRRAEVTVAVAPGNRREVQLGTQVPVTGSPAAPGSPEVMGAPVVVLRAIDAAGRTVMMAWTILGPDATSIVLPATAVELLAVSDDGRRGSITVASAGNEPLVIPLTRR